MTSLDVFIPNSPQIQAPDTDGVNGAVVCTIKTPFQQATHHGTVITDGRKNILRMEYKMSLDRMSKNVYFKIMYLCFCIDLIVCLSIIVFTYKITFMKSFCQHSLHGDSRSKFKLELN